MKNIFILFLLLYFTFPIFSQVNIDLEEYATGFSSPVDIENAGDDRLFIVERSGRIKIIDGSGTVLPTPFLDIDDIVADASFQSEQGLLGLAFHPDYANNGYFFVNYTNNSGDTRIARYTRNATNPNLADPNSGTIILSIDQPYANHNGGCIKFGPDGYLYIGMGDGGSGDDPQGNGQNNQVLLAKILRIDIDNGSPYAIPTDNPFVNDANTLDEIWATGIRNPWRFSFDRETGDLWIADVGQNAWEEVDFQPANSSGGENYGWRCREGNHANNNVNQANCGSASDYTSPIFEVQHNGFTGPCSITGGYVYRGSEYPDVLGKYFCADFCTGQFFTVEPDGAGGWTGQEVADFNYDITTFGEDVNGELYVARLSGNIYKLTADGCGNLAASVNITHEPCEGETNGSVTITAAGGTPPYTILPALDFSNLAPNNYTVTITDNAGCTSVQSFTINSLPLPDVPTFTINDNLLTAPAGFTAYQWLLNGTAIAGATSPTYTVSESGNYAIEVTAPNGCNNTSTATTVTYTSLASIPSLSELNVRPNPFGKNIFVEISVKEAVDLEIEILNMNGKVVFSKKTNIKEKYTQQIDLEKLSAGIYYLNLKSENGIVVKKLIKQDN